MYILILRNLIFVSISYILFLSSFLYGMDNIYDFAFKQVIIPNTISYDIYTIHRTLAVLNSEYNAIIEKNYRPEKKCIEQLMQKNDTPLVHEKISWSKNFSKCAWVTVQQNSNNGIKNLEFTVIGLVDKQLQIKRNKWPYYMFLATGDKTRPIFNDNGEASIVIYAEFEMNDNLLETYNGFLKYSIDAKGNSSTRRCLIEVGNGDKFFEFNTILNLPQLLQAILQSTQVSQRRLTYPGDTVELYNINGVTFPDNYKTFVKHLIFGFINCSAYNDLPFFLREAIDKQYQARSKAIKNEWLLLRNLMYDRALSQCRNSNYMKKI